MRIVQTAKADPACWVSGKKQKFPADSSNEREPLPTELQLGQEEAHLSFWASFCFEQESPF